MTGYLLSLGIGYLLGSIPFGLLLTRAAGLGDVRKIGSGNIGATNVLRTGNKALAALTLLLDTLKGTAAVLLGYWIGSRIAGAGFGEAPLSPGLGGLAELIDRTHTLIVANGVAAGLGAFLGHLYPVWLGFRGGKGVATYIGVLIAISWKAALAFAAVWLAVAWLSRYSSLSALVAALVVLAVLAVTAGPLLGLAAALMSALLFWKHRENIKRLLSGTESKIGAKGN